MRKFFASVLAFVASLFAGGMVAQALAVLTNAGEEYIVVFALAVLVAFVVTVPFFVAQFFASGRRAVGATAVACLLVFASIGLALTVWTILETGGVDLSKDASIIAGLVLPGIVIIVVQWLIVRGMLPAAYTPQFGRGARDGA